MFVWPYTKVTDILMNGIYWDENVPRLFELEDLKQPGFKIQSIADITDDKNGSVPCNLGDTSIEDPIYGVDKNTFRKTLPYLPGSIDVMAVGNLLTNFHGTHPDILVSNYWNIFLMHWSVKDLK